MSKESANGSAQADKLAAGSAGSAGSASGGNSPIRVLVVDDDENVREILTAYLASPEYNVDIATDGNEAVEHVRGHEVDVVVTDLIMPNREGIETIFEIGRLKPNCPIIAISGGGRTGNSDYLEVARRIGAGVTLKKPFKKAQLIEAIHSALGK